MKSSAALFALIASSLIAQPVMADSRDWGADEWSSVVLILTTSGPTLSTMSGAKKKEIALLKAVQDDASLYVGRQSAGQSPEMTSLLLEAVTRFKDVHPTLSDDQVMAQILDVASQY